MNCWEHCTGGACVGRESISIEALEDLARSYAANEKQPFISYAGAPSEEDWPFQGWPYRASRGRRMRDDTVEPVAVEIHPDPLCQEILEQIRESEVLQTIDRTRPIFNPWRLVLMNELCLDVTYDRILTHAELVAGGTRWDRAWQANGIIPLGAADLHRVHADLFPTVEAARLALKRESPKMGSNLKRDPIWILTPFNYRRVGQRGKQSRVLVDTARHPDPRAAVEGVLGPLEKFEVEFQPNTDQQLLPPR